MSMNIEFFKTPRRVGHFQAWRSRYADSGLSSLGLPQLTGSQAGELHYLVDRGPPKRYLSEKLRPHAAGLPFHHPFHPSTLQSFSLSVILMISPLVFLVFLAFLAPLIQQHMSPVMSLATAKTPVSTCIHDAGPSSLFLHVRTSKAAKCKWEPYFR